MVFPMQKKISNS